MLYSALPAIESYIRAGKLRMVAVSTQRRSAEAPEIPTVAELGVPGYEFAPQIGVLAPAGTPPAVVQKLSASLARASCLFLSVFSNRSTGVRSRLKNAIFNILNNRESSAESAGINAPETSRKLG